jgi:tRNA A37 threonylcarbamoyladenosine synthetase subunit TsaC/SUA5/YrdC
MPSRLEDVHPQLLQEVDFVLGDTQGEGTSSTVVAWNDGEKKWLIYREGPISKKQLNALTGG